MCAANWPLPYFIWDQFFYHISSFYAPWFEFLCDSLFVPLCVSSPMVDSLVVDLGFRCCVMTFTDIYTCVEFIILDVVDFYVICPWTGYHTNIRS